MSTPVQEPEARAATPSVAEQIVKTPGVCGGKARIAGTRIRVQDIYVWHELQGKPVDQIVSSFPQLTHAQVHAALPYFFTRPEEIRAQIAEDEKQVEELKRRIGPGLLQDTLAKHKANAADDQFPSRRKRR